MSPYKHLSLLERGSLGGDTGKRKRSRAERAFSNASPALPVQVPTLSLPGSVTLDMGVVLSVCQLFPLDNGFKSLSDSEGHEKLKASFIICKAL